MLRLANNVQSFATILTASTESLKSSLAVTGDTFCYLGHAYFYIDGKSYMHKLELRNNRNYLTNHT